MSTKEHAVDLVDELGRQLGSFNQKMQHAGDIDAYLAVQQLKSHRLYKLLDNENSQSTREKLAVLEETVKNKSQFNGVSEDILKAFKKDAKYFRHLLQIADFELALPSAGFTYGDFETAYIAEILSKS